MVWVLLVVAVATLACAQWAANLEREDGLVVHLGDEKVGVEANVAENLGKVSVEEGEAAAWVMVDVWDGEKPEEYEEEVLQVNP